MFIEGDLPIPVDFNQGKQLQVFNQGLFIGMFGADQNVDVFSIFLPDGEKADLEGIPYLLDDLRGYFPALLDSLVIGNIE